MLIYDMEKQPVSAADRVQAKHVAFIVPGEVAAIESTVFPGDREGPIVSTTVMLKNGAAISFSKLSTEQLVHLLGLEDKK